MSSNDDPVDDRSTTTASSEYSCTRQLTKDWLRELNMDQIYRGSHERFYIGSSDTKLIVGDNDVSHLMDAKDFNQRGARPASRMEAMILKESYDKFINEFQQRRSQSQQDPATEHQLMTEESKFIGTLAREAISQVSVVCNERGQLLLDMWTRGEQLRETSLTRLGKCQSSLHQCQHEMNRLQSVLHEAEGQISALKAELSDCRIAHEISISEVDQYKRRVQVERATLDDVRSRHVTELSQLASIAVTAEHEQHQSMIEVQHLKQLLTETRTELYSVTGVPLSQQCVTCEPTATLMLHGISDTVTEANVTELLVGLHYVTRTRLTRSIKSDGYVVFVKFGSVDSAQLAHSRITSCDDQYRVSYVGIYPTDTLQVRGFHDPSRNGTKIRPHFQQYGTVNTVKNSNGTALVQMGSIEMAITALQRCNRVVQYDGSILRIVFVQSDAHDVMNYDAIDDNVTTSKLIEMKSNRDDKEMRSTERRSIPSLRETALAVRDDISHEREKARSDSPVRKRSDQSGNSGRSTPNRSSPTIGSKPHHDSSYVRTTRPSPRHADNRQPMSSTRSSSPESSSSAQKHSASSKSPEPSTPSTGTVTALSNISVTLPTNSAVTLSTGNVTPVKVISSTGGRPIASNIKSVNMGPTSPSTVGLLSPDIYVPEVQSSNATISISSSIDVPHINTITQPVVLPAPSSVPNDIVALRTALETSHANFNQYVNDTSETIAALQAELIVKRHGRANHHKKANKSKVPKSVSAASSSGPGDTVTPNDDTNDFMDRRGSLKSSVSDEQSIPSNGINGEHHRDSSLTSSDISSTSSHKRTTDKSSSSQILKKAMKKSSTVNSLPHVKSQQSISSSQHKRMATQKSVESLISTPSTSNGPSPSRSNRPSPSKTSGPSTSSSKGPSQRLSHNGSKPSRRGVKESNVTCDEGTEENISSQGSIASVQPEADDIMETEMIGPPHMNPSGGLIPTHPTRYRDDPLGRQGHDRSSPMESRVMSGGWKGESPAVSFRGSVAHQSNTKHSLLSRTQPVAGVSPGSVVGGGQQETPQRVIPTVISIDDNADADDDDNMSSDPIAIPSVSSHTSPSTITNINPSTQSSPLIPNIRPLPELSRSRMTHSDGEIRVRAVLKRIGHIYRSKGSLDRRGLSLSDYIFDDYAPVNFGIPSLIGSTCDELYAAAVALAPSLPEVSLFKKFWDLFYGESTSGLLALYIRIRTTCESVWETSSPIDINDEPHIEIHIAARTLADLFPTCTQYTQHVFICELTGKCRHIDMEGQSSGISVIGLHQFLEFIIEKEYELMRRFQCEMSRLFAALSHIKRQGPNPLSHYIKLIHSCFWRSTRQQVESAVELAIRSPMTVTSFINGLQSLFPSCKDVSLPSVMEFPPLSPVQYRPECLGLMRLINDHWQSFRSRPFGFDDAISIIRKAGRSLHPFQCGIAQLEDDRDRLDSLLRYGMGSEALLAMKMLISHIHMAMDNIECWPHIDCVNPIRGSYMSDNDGRYMTSIENGICDRLEHWRWISAPSTLSAAGPGHLTAVVLPETAIASRVPSDIIEDVRTVQYQVGVNLRRSLDPVEPLPRPADNITLMNRGSLGPYYCPHMTADPSYQSIRQGHHNSTGSPSHSMALYHLKRSDSDMTLTAPIVKSRLIHSSSAVNQLSGSFRRIPQRLQKEMNRSNTVPGALS